MLQSVIGYCLFSNQFLYKLLVSIIWGDSADISLFDHFSLW